MSFLWKDGRRRESLPIDSRLGEVLSLLAASQVVVVEAETGAGKTTRIPQAVLLEHPDMKIWMTQTRRNAVRWNGKRIAQEMGCHPGSLVGWRLFGEEPTTSRETRLTLVIDQALTNRIRHEGRLPKGLLVIDEAHERSVSTDLLLGLIKEALPNSPETKILVTSATIDTKKFSEFFGGAPVMSVAGRCYQVSTEVVRLGKYEHHSEAAGRAAGTVLERFVKGELQTPTADGTEKQAVSFGTVLVLLPGKDDISNVMRQVQWQAEQLKCQDRVQILSCHGESSPEEQDRVQDRIPPNTIRFVCGTEVLRSSVTIRNTVGVIDSLQVKRLITDAKGVAHLDKIAISKAEADQGKGRAGRTQPGFYIASSFESEYERLQPYPTPAILREPITHVALQVAAVGRSIRDFAFIDAPEKAKVEVAITRLKRLGALDEQEAITDVGEMLVQFPIDPERAKVLVTADALGVLPEAVAVTAVLESEGIFFGPGREQKDFVFVEEPILRRILSWFKKSSWGDEWRKEDRQVVKPEEVDLNDVPKWAVREGSLWKIVFESEETYGEFHEEVRWIADQTRRHFAAGSSSDFVAIVRCYRAFKAEERRIKETGAKNRDQAMAAWCQRWFVNSKRVRMAENVMHQIREELASSPLRLENGLGQDREFSAEALTKALASGLTDNVARKNGRDFSGPLGDFQLAYQSACPQGAELVLVGSVRKIPTTGRRGRSEFIFLADTAASLKPEWLGEVMPQLCSKKRLGNHSYDPNRDAVVETEEQYFIDTKVGEPAVVTQDAAAAAKTFCSWLAEQMSGGRY